MENDNQGVLLEVREALNMAKREARASGFCMDEKLYDAALIKLDALIADVPDLSDSYHRMNDIKANLRTHVEFDHASILMSAVGYMAVSAKLLQQATTERKDV